MDDKEKLMSGDFQVFMRESPQHAQAWMTAVQNLGNASVIDKKTESLAYLAVLSVLRLENSIPFHVAIAAVKKTTSRKTNRWHLHKNGFV